MKGAEAELKRDGDTIVKDRIEKSYRITEIDKVLRRRRTRQEAGLLREARRAGVATPKILEEGLTTLRLEYIYGRKVKDVLDKNVNIAKFIGENIAKLHQYDIIHGDLTTSNMLIDEGKVFFIDFGLGFVSKRVEDKANDLYLLKEVLESTHFAIWQKAWKMVLDAYKAQYPDGQKVIKALLEVEKRGRYKKR